MEGYFAQPFIHQDRDGFKTQGFIELDLRHGVSAFDGDHGAGRFMQEAVCNSPKRCRTGDGFNGRTQNDDIRFFGIIQNDLRRIFCDLYFFCTSGI